MLALPTVSVAAFAATGTTIDTASRAEIQGLFIRVFMNVASLLETQRTLCVSAGKTLPTFCST